MYLLPISSLETPFFLKNTKKLTPSTIRMASRPLVQLINSSKYAKKRPRSFKRHQLKLIMSGWKTKIVKERRSNSLQIIAGQKVVFRVGAQPKTLQGIRWLRHTTAPNHALHEPLQELFYCCKETVSLYCPKTLLFCMKIFFSSIE